ncbi:head-tail connector protein [Roseivivax sediminis]|uniref:Phage gp6-like head-tail connector protein n=1 Tax=Roseivivax sediminis TaxID=936889 RepID=A0A1I1TCD1_9RHOB|nr:head-tail connector protein [Roseivivax sediminis]SFD53973.1 phage conserved hypothetical protein, phiE125 gp8 family [Roseivivax sediminis]
MILTKETSVPDAALPVDALKHHLRLGSGFAASTVQDPVLTSFLRAAMAAIEARTGKALLQRDFVLTLERWDDPEAQPLPIAPIAHLSQVTITDRTGTAEYPDIFRFRTTADMHAPRLRYQQRLLPRIPEGGSAEIRFTAGYGETCDDLPADLVQAVMLLAAHYYEYRDATALGEGCMPFGVTSLVARYRQMRVGFTS